MRSWRPILILSALLCCVQAYAALADGFVSGTEDVPLMPGLTETAGGALVFDSPAGRIVEVVAVGEADATAVLAFYASTLPQLGWTKLGAAQYRREGEVLNLSFPSDGEVHLKVAPQDQ